MLDSSVSKGNLRLGEVSLAHDHLGLGALIGGYGVVQVQAAGGVLLEERTDTLQVPLGLELQGFVLVELGFGPLHVRAVRLGVDDEQGLVLPDVGAFLEQYLLEVSLDPCTYLHELLGTDFSGVLTVESMIHAVMPATSTPRMTYQIHFGSLPIFLIRTAILLPVLVNFSVGMFICIV